jgi:hypothetical protein
MKLRHVVGLFVLAVALVALSPLSGSAAQNKKKKSAERRHDAHLIHELRKTAHLLTKADRDYKGHRAAAVKQIKHAIEQLRKEAHLHGHKIPNAYKGPEPQPVSDAQLKKAQGQLNSILGELNRLKATKHREKAAEHITSAIGELKTALTIA